MALNLVEVPPTVHVFQTVHEHIDTALTQVISPLAPSRRKLPVSETLVGDGFDLVLCSCSTVNSLV